MSRVEELTLLAQLLRSQRWASLATLEAGGAPYASAVACVPATDFSAFFLHLSGLAPHTRNLLAHPAASLLISASDPGEGDPQTLPRVSLMGHAEPLAKDSEDYVAGKTLYLERIPSAEPLFDFPDFLLFRFVPSEARYVGGFARARRFEPSALREAAALNVASA